LRRIGRFRFGFISRGGTRALEARIDRRRSAAAQIARALLARRRGGRLRVDHVLALRAANRKRARRNFRVVELKARAALLADDNHNSMSYVRLRNGE
jgi:hypothetical protein